MQFWSRYTCINWQQHIFFKQKNNNNLATMTLGDTARWFVCVWKQRMWEVSQIIYFKTVLMQGHETDTVEHPVSEH